MSAPSRIIVSFLLCGFYYALLTVHWPGPWSGPAPILMDAYRSAFRAEGNLLFFRMGNNYSARFKSYDGPRREQVDTTVRVENVRTRIGGEIDFSAISIGYRVTAFLVALILATPFPWSRRLKVLLWGLVWVTVFVALRMWLRTVDEFAKAGMLIYPVGPSVTRVVRVMTQVLVHSTGTSYMVVAFIWIVTAFRREDLDRFLGQGPPTDPDSTAPAVSDRPSRRSKRRLASAHR